VLGKRARRAVCIVVPAVTLAALMSQPVTAGAPATGRSHVRTVSTADREPDRLADPQRLLPAGWRASQDRAVAVAGDATGLHVLAADAADGYLWRTVATLAVRGTDTSQ
jgi:hypothetical protein